MFRILTTLLAAAFIGGTMLAPAFAQGKKLRIADANSFMLIQSFQIFVPLAMGWWAKDGYDVDVVHNQGSAAAVQSLVGGGADLAVANSSPTLSAVAKGAADLRIAFNFVSTSWRLITPKTSGIQSVGDLKGKKIGVISAGGGATAYLETLLRQNNVDPLKDVTLIPIGVGAQAFQAVKAQTVDAYMDYTSDIIQLEALGGDYTKFYDEAWLSFPDYGLVTKQGFVSASPEAAIAIAKGMAKANVFAQENPECVAKIYQKAHATGATPRPLDRDIKFVNGFMADMLVAREKNGSGLWGTVNKDNLQKLVNFLAENKVIAAPFDAGKVLVDMPDFAKKVNDFSLDEVKAEAKACKGF